MGEWCWVGAGKFGFVINDLSRPVVCRSMLQSRRASNQPEDDGENEVGHLFHFDFGVWSKLQH